MAAPMDADVDQRLSMSLDDLIKSKKPAAPKSAAKAAGTKAKPAAKGGAAGKQTKGRGRQGAKDKQPAVARLAAGGGAKAAGRKRGGRAASTGLGVNVAALKNAPKRIAKAAANAINAATAMVTGSSTKGGGRGSAKAKAGGRGRGRAGAATPARSRGAGDASAGRGGTKPVADLRVTIDNKLHSRGSGGRGRGAGGRGGGRGGGRQTKDGVKIPTGW